MFEFLQKFRAISCHKCGTTVVSRDKTNRINILGLVRRDVSFKRMSHLAPWATHS